MPPEWAPPCIRPGEKVIKKAVLLDKTADTTKVQFFKRDIEFIMLPRLPTVRRPPPPIFPKIRLIVPRIEKLHAQSKGNMVNGLLPSLNFDVNAILRELIPAPLPPTSHVEEPPSTPSDSARTTRPKVPIRLRLRKQPVPGFVPEIQICQELLV